MPAARSWRYSSESCTRAENVSMRSVGTSNRSATSPSSWSYAATRGSSLWHTRSHAPQWMHRNMDCASSGLTGQETRRNLELPAARDHLGVRREVRGAHGDARPARGAFENRPVQRVAVGGGALVRAAGEPGDHRARDRHAEPREPRGHRKSEYVPVPGLDPEELP